MFDQHEAPPVEEVQVLLTAPSLPEDDELGLLSHWQAPFVDLWRDALKSVARDALRQRERAKADARVADEIRRSSQPAAKPKPYVPGRPLPARRDGESLRDHQVRVNKARRPSPSKPEPTTLEKLQRRTGTA